MRVCNVYSLLSWLNSAKLPTPTISGMIYMGNFHARNTALGDFSSTAKRHGTQLLEYSSNQLIHWVTDAATHAPDGTLDHVLTCGLYTSDMYDENFWNYVIWTDEKSFMTTATRDYVCWWPFSTRYAEENIFYSSWLEVGAIVWALMVGWGLGD